MAAVLDLPALAKRHEAVAGSAFPVACSTEAWDVFHFDQPADNLIQSTAVDHIELLGLLIFRLRLAVAADAGSGTAADLGDAQVKDALSGLLAFSGGDDHAGIWNRNSYAGYDLGKGIVIDSIGKGGCVDIVGIAQPGNADGMRSYAERCFQMLCMHQKSCKFIAELIQAEQNAYAYIVDAALHCAVHSLRVIIIVVLRPCWVKLQDVYKRQEMEAAHKYIFEYVPNKYSVTPENLRNADAIELKIGQGTKPGMGGHLPGGKVTPEIAAVRNKPLGKDVISPSKFEEINNKEDLKDLVAQLRLASGGRPIGIKIAAGRIEKDLEFCVYAEPDFITIDGRGGATGASPRPVSYTHLDVYKRQVEHQPSKLDTWVRFPSPA